ncbi:YxcD family protein [Paenibacillus arenilitoris]|uniref:YxcD family protein n=1 Tax=Paenibacillus arenilitoris TaxID=2772299 RepID=A0A927CN21_9BACL|nr:YxcD family protein [Paenibacillus arenilitoris]MBD2869857.1 YxcD family protein [Paenibacillus arenilitoris]
MRIYTDEIINAICLHMAERRGVKPSDVEVQLSWEEQYGFTAEVWVSGRSQYIIESNILEAIEQYMYKEYNRRVFRSSIKLDADEEFWAEIED